MNIIIKIEDGEDLAKYLETQAMECKGTYFYDIVFKENTHEQLVNKCSQLIECYDEIEDSTLYSIVRYDDMFKNIEDENEQ